MKTFNPVTFSKEYAQFLQEELAELENLADTYVELNDFGEKYFENKFKIDSEELHRPTVSQLAREELLNFLSPGTTVVHKSGKEVMILGTKSEYFEVMVFDNKSGSGIRTDFSIDTMKLWVSSESLKSLKDANGQIIYEYERGVE